MTLQCRLNRPEETPQILEFIQSMGYTGRDTASWAALSMQAAIALDSGKVVGAIPCEVRRVLFDGIAKTVAHETVVAVSPDLRGQGVGSRLQDVLVETPPSNAELLTVFREDPESAAYRWYYKNGFRPQMPITAYVENTPKVTKKPADTFWRSTRDAPWLQIEAIRARNCIPRTSGLVFPESRPYKNWLSVHPYRDRYSFHIVCAGPEEAITGYMLVGTGKLHSVSERIEILDFASLAGHEEAIRSLLDAVRLKAYDNSYSPVRWAMCDSDPSVVLLKGSSFVENWKFDFLAKPLCDIALEQIANWHYRSIDFI